MEPNKFEQDIKKKLDGRTIAPSPMAWDRLDAMMSVAETKKANNKKPLIMWLSMAACFVALLLAGTLFLNRESNNPQNSIDSNNNTVVVAPEKVIEKTDISIQEEVEKTWQNKTQENTVVAERNQIKKVQQHNKTLNKTEIKTALKEEIQEEEQIAQVQSTEKVEDKKTSRLSVDAAALLASVEQPQQDNPEISRSKTRKAKIKVSSNDLLSSVEEELDDNFRSKIFISVEKNYKVVKQAVATRNLE